jgi:DnaJ-class molecular chaperone
MIITVKHNQDMTGHQLAQNIKVIFAGRTISAERHFAPATLCRQCKGTGVNAAGHVCHNCKGHGEK